MENEKITDELAWRIRSSGLHLPTDKEYVNPLTKEMALRQKELFDEISALDIKLFGRIL